MPGGPGAAANPAASGTIQPHKKARISNESSAPVAASTWDSLLQVAAAQGAATPQTTPTVETTAARTVLNSPATVSQLAPSTGQNLDGRRSLSANFGIQYAGPPNLTPVLSVPDHRRPPSCFSSEQVARFSSPFDVPDVHAQSAKGHAQPGEGHAQPGLLKDRCSVTSASEPPPAQAALDQAQNIPTGFLLPLNFSNAAMSSLLPLAKTDPRTDPAAGANPDWLIYCLLLPTAVHVRSHQRHSHVAEGNLH